MIFFRIGRHHFSPVSYKSNTVLPSMYELISRIFSRIGTLTHIAPVFASNRGAAWPNDNKNQILCVNVHKKAAISTTLIYCSAAPTAGAFAPLISSPKESRREYRLKCGPDRIARRRHHDPHHSAAAVDDRGDLSDHGRSGRIVRIR
jgi:hypothetical protein